MAEARSDSFEQNYDLLIELVSLSLFGVWVWWDLDEDDERIDKISKSKTLPR